MTKLILSGCNGHMGRVISACVEDMPDCTIVAGIDRNTDIRGNYPVFPRPDMCAVAGDVIIDFSHPSVTEILLDYALKTNTPVVLATTGLGEEQIQKVREAARKIPVFFTANMSLGVNLVAHLCKRAAAILGTQFDIEIVERHHNQKVDAPSGTALMLADVIAQSLPHEPQYVFNRQGVRKKRDKNEIGIHAVRGGTIVGDHEVIFAGHDEVITISHSASSKDVFAIGAINAALFLKNKKPGLYSMDDLV